MNPLRPRWLRTAILFATGVAVCLVAAWLLTPIWPNFCTATTVGAPCSTVDTQRMTGYLMIGLGLGTMILGPIAGSFIDVAINGHKWETGRGTESVITNVPVVIGAVYMVLGLIVAATA
jgi:hypothetical protein